MLDADTDIGGPNTRFPDTRHSALLDMGGEKPARTLAYEAIIGAYWKPVYRYIRLRWHKSNEDAKDLTQAFFAFAVEKNLFQEFEKEKARFRTYLRTCLDRFLVNQQRFSSRQKRSGESVPLDDSLADGLSSSGASPEELFQREFARNMFAEAVEQLRTALRPVPFAVFERYDLAEPPDRLSYQQIASALDIPVTSVTNHLALARRELRRILLERLRPITRDESELRRESRALFQQ
jgi:RNA polymerase sigma factor (sigma-70 family)